MSSSALGRSEIKLLAKLSLGPDSRGGELPRGGEEREGIGERGVVKGRIIEEGLSGGEGLRAEGVPLETKGLKGTKKLSSGARGTTSTNDNMEEAFLRGVLP